MSGMTNYVQPLRAIGQALETLNLQSFELETVEEGFYVRGILVNAHPELSHDLVTADKLNAIWGATPDATNSGDRSRHQGSNTQVLSPIELQYNFKRDGLNESILIGCRMARACHKCCVVSTHISIRNVPICSVFLATPTPFPSNIRHP